MFKSSSFEMAERPIDRGVPDGEPNGLDPRGVTEMPAFDPNLVRRRAMRKR
jgi:hypothetical protein